MTTGYAICGVLWFACSLLILVGLSDIKPSKRGLTKPKIVRFAMLIGGPVTIVVITVGFSLFALFVMVPMMIFQVFSDKEETE